MQLRKEHISIMEHTRDRAAGGFYCGGSPEMQELVAAGLMADAGRKSFVPDPYYQLTGKGREALRLITEQCIGPHDSPRTDAPPRP